MVLKVECLIILPHASVLQIERSNITKCLFKMVKVQSISNGYTSNWLESRLIIMKMMLKVTGSLHWRIHHIQWHKKSDTTSCFTSLSFVCQHHTVGSQLTWINSWVSLRDNSSQKINFCHGFSAILSLPEVVVQCSKKSFVKNRNRFYRKKLFEYRLWLNKKCILTTWSNCKIFTLF